MNKRLVLSGLAMAIALAWFVPSRAADNAKAREFKGKGLCAKCELKKTDKCQTAIKVKEDDKEVIYLLDFNDVSNKFHKNICTSVKEIIVIGTIKEEDGKKIVVPTKIELVRK